MVKLDYDSSNLHMTYQPTQELAVRGLYVCMILTNASMEVCTLCRTLHHHLIYILLCRIWMSQAGVEAFSTAYNASFADIADTQAAPQGKPSL